MRSAFSVTRVSAAVLILFAIAACGKKEAPAAGGGAPPPPAVSVFTIEPGRVAVSAELPGRVEALRVAEVRARVAGIVQKRTFREGSEVKAGTVLFQIDASPFQAAFNSAEASVARAEATALQANLKAQRYKPLVETNAISKQEYDDMLAIQKQAVADLAVARAARQTARLTLDYATVTAPISGRIGRALVTEGALVGQGETTPLATIQQIDSVYVNVTQSSRELLELQRALANGQLQRAGKDQVQVKLKTEDGQDYPQPGKLLFSDVSVDPTSGAVTLRAEFPNPNRALLPGMYVRTSIEQAVRDNAITVPQQAVSRTPEGAAVLLVGAEDKVVRQAVKTDGANGNNWIVTEGLKAGDRVIVQGLQKVQPGATVKPEAWQPPSATPATPAAAPAKAPAAPAPAAQSK